MVKRDSGDTSHTSVKKQPAGLVVAFRASSLSLVSSLSAAAATRQASAVLMTSAPDSEQLEFASALKNIGVEVGTVVAGADVGLKASSVAVGCVVVGARVGSEVVTDVV